MKNVTSKVALLALCSGFAAAGCSSDQVSGSDDAKNTDPNKGSVSFNLVGEDQNGTEYSIDTVHVVVTDSTSTVVFDDDIEVSGPEETAALALLLPVGTGYELSATATGTGSTDVDGDGTPDPVSVPCENASEVMFDIAAGPNPPIALAMLCDVPSPDTNTGSAQVNASFTFEQGEACGLLTMLVGPLQRPLGGVYTTEGTGTPDVTAYEWTATSTNGGACTFGDSGAASTHCTCTSAGTIDITLTVTNVAEDCEDSHTVQVECTTPYICGDDSQDPGEECDGTDTPAGEECNADCELIECGDGDVEGSETCDDGGESATCDADCSTVSCGDGTTNATAGEECDPVGSTVPGGTCQPGCQLPVALSCEECTAMFCSSQLTACADSANNGTIATGVTGNRCEATYDCISNPMANGNYCIVSDGDTSPLSCACPAGMNALDCGNADPNYPPIAGNADLECLPIMRRAANATGAPPASMGTLMFNLVDTAFAVGDALNIVACQLPNCAASCEHIQP